MLGAVGIILHLPSDDAGGADTLCPLGDQELALCLDRLVDIIALVGLVRQVVVRDIVDLMLGQKLRGNNPWAIRNNLVHPFAMPNGLCALGTTEHGQTLTLMCFFIASNTDNQVHFGESLFGLLELSHVAI